MYIYIFFHCATIERSIRALRNFRALVNHPGKLLRLPLKGEKRWTKVSRARQRSVAPALIPHMRGVRAPLKSATYVATGYGERYVFENALHRRFAFAGRDRVVFVIYSA